MKTIHGRGYVYAIEYHIVWCVKYRRKVLTEPVEKRLKVLLEKYASENEFTIAEFNTDKDHVHLLIEASPQHYIPNMIRGLKGTSARELFKSFPNLKSKLWGGHLWNPSYFVATVSDHLEDEIKKYIQSQKEK